MTDVARKEELAQARATASQIRQGIHNYLHTLALIGKAWEQSHWRILGYDSWQSYVDGEFGEDRLKLPTEHRRKAVEELRLLGMSQRAIGTALGVPQSTVRDDLQVSGSTHLEETKGTDGKTYAASRPSTPSGDRKADAQPAPARDAESEAPTRPPVGAGETAAEIPPATGLHSADAIDEEDGLSPSVRVDAAGAPTDTREELLGSSASPVGAPVNPLDDPVQIERAHRERTSERVATGLVNIYSALDPDPIAWLAKWVPNAYRNRGIPFVEDILTPTGIRAVAKHLNALADYLDETDGAL